MKVPTSRSAENQKALDYERISGIDMTAQSGSEPDQTSTDTSYERPTVGWRCPTIGDALKRGT